MSDLELGIGVEIELSKGAAIALVSPEDFAEVSQFSWYLHRGRYTNYAFRKEKGIKIYMHRELAIAHYKFSPVLVDHHNRNGLDNRRKNLRPGCYTLNALNRVRSVRSALGVPGVRRQGRGYAVHLCKRYVGTYDSLEEAVSVYTDLKEGLVKSLTLG